MGGRNGQQLAIEIMDYTHKYCVGNQNITQGELQDVIEQLMDEEFNTVCDDNSIPGEKFCNIFQLSAQLHLIVFRNLSESVALQTNVPPGSIYSN